MRTACCSLLVVLDGHAVHLPRTDRRNQVCLNVLANSLRVPFAWVAPATAPGRDGEQAIALLQKRRDLAGQIDCRSVGTRHRAARAGRLRAAEGAPRMYCLAVGT